MKNFLNALGKLAVLAVFILAIWLLYNELRSYSLAEIKFNLAQIPASGLLLSLLLMILNYTVMIGYDWLALKAIRKKLHMGKVCLVSFVGCVISYNFGALLGGSTARYRLYSAWGFTALDIVRLVLMLAVTFWVGAMGLAGLIFLFVSLDIPPELGISAAQIRLLGGFLLLFCAAYLAFCGFRKGRPFKVFRREFTLPTLPIAVAQTLVAGLDLVVAAFCLYVLMPQDSGMTFLEFMPNYLLAQVTVVLTHVPGGMGVLEVIIMNLTHTIPPQRVFAAILAFRVVYYLLPLIFASVALGLYELYLRTRKADIISQETSRWLRLWMPTILSYAVFLAGAVLCVLAVVPGSVRHILLLKDYIPLWMLESAHILTGLSGIAMMALAHGLQQRKKSWWRLIIIVLCAGIFSNLCKGINLPESVMLLAVLFPVALLRKDFGRIASFWKTPYPYQWFIAVTLVMLFTTALGLYFAGIPTDGDVLLKTGYTLTGPRILRTLAVQILFLIGLVLFFANTKLWHSLRK